MQVKRFFLRTLGLHVTTTTIRTLVETTATQMMDEGAITQTQRAAIRNINGHTSQTTEDFYVLRDRWNDANNGRSMFNAILNNTTNDTNMEEEEQLNSMNTRSPEAEVAPGKLSPWNRTQAAIKPWGTMHPSFTSTEEAGIPPRRVHWSADEVAYIARWHTENDHDTRENKVSRCLQKIQTDPEARGKKSTSLIETI